MTETRSAKTHVCFLDREDTSDIDFTDYSAPYLSGHGFSLRCGSWWAPGMKQLGKNPHRDNIAIYMKTEHVKPFFQSGLVPERFILLTHNSDFVVGLSFINQLADPRLIAWLAMNKGLDHPKLHSIPDGLQNPCYGYGNTTELEAHKNDEKTTLFYANYTIDSNFIERGRCAAACQPQSITLWGRCPWPDYVKNLASAMFAPCPNGSGIDSCRTWEALYVRTVPIVTKSHVADAHADFPMVIINEWTEPDLNIRRFTPELYRSLWRNFDRNMLTVDGYWKRIRDLYGVEL